MIKFIILIFKSDCCKHKLKMNPLNVKMNPLNRVAMPGFFIFLNGSSILEIILLYGFQSVHALQPP